MTAISSDQPYAQHSTIYIVITDESAPARPADVIFTTVRSTTEKLESNSKKLGRQKCSPVSEIPEGRGDLVGARIYLYSTDLCYLSGCSKYCYVTRSYGYYHVDMLKTRTRRYDPRNNYAPINPKSLYLHHITSHSPSRIF